MAQKKSVFCSQWVIKPPLSLFIQSTTFYHWTTEEDVNLLSVTKSFMVMIGWKLVELTAVAQNRLGKAHVASFTGWLIIKPLQTVKHAFFLITDLSSSVEKSVHESVVCLFPQDWLVASCFVAFWPGITVLALRLSLPYTTLRWLDPLVFLPIHYGGDSTTYIEFLNDPWLTDQESEYTCHALNITGYFNRAQEFKRAQTSNSEHGWNESNHANSAVTLISAFELPPSDPCIMMRWCIFTPLLLIVIKHL